MKVTLTTILVGLCLCISGQSLPDSISSNLKEMPGDTNKVQYLNDLSRTYWRNDVILAKEFAFSALHLSVDLRFKEGECRALNYLGIVYTNTSDFDSATIYLDKAHELAERIANSRLEYGILNSKGIVQKKLGNYELAAEHYIDALAFAEQIGTATQVASILLNIGNIHFELDNFDRAAEFYQKSLEKFEQIESPAGVGHLLNNLGNVYGRLNDTDQSLAYFQRSLAHKEKTNNSRGLGTTHVNIAMLYRSLDSLDLAGIHFGKAIEYYEQTGIKADAVHAYYGIAGLQADLEQYNLAQQYASRALQIAEQSGLKEEMKNTNKLLAKIYEKTNNHVAALSHFMEYSSIKDTLFQETTSRAINELEIKYETTKKEKEIIEANAEIDKKQRFQIFLYIIIGTVILFSSIAIFLIIQRFKLKRKLLYQEIDTLRVQINSIFGGATQKLDLSIEQINDGLFKPLSEREFEILNVAISDKTNGEIAETVFVSVNTVKTHLKNIYMKLGVSNRKEALEVLLTKS